MWARVRDAIRSLKLPALTQVKDGVAVLRDITIFALFLLLLLFPAVLNERLISAGFEEGSLAGMKWKRRVVASDTQLKEAQGQIIALQKQLSENQKALEQARPQAAGPVQAQISAVQEGNVRISQRSNATLQSIEATIERNEPAVSRAIESLGENPRWAVVFGGDPSIEAARHEIARAQRAGLESPQIVFRQNSYRSIVSLPTRDSAQRALEVARRQLRPDSYLVSLAMWCPRMIPGEGYSSCDLSE